MLTSFTPQPLSSSRTLINSHADYDLLFWAKRLGIPQDVLKGAIQEVGNDLCDVERHLRAGLPTLGAAPSQPRHA